MRVNWGTLRGHLFVLLAVSAGIAGMGIVFNGISHGSWPEISRGMPFLLLGLWWSGRALALSMAAHHARARRPKEAA